jgi:hypothetical protein
MTALLFFLRAPLEDGALSIKMAVGRLATHRLVTGESLV